MAAGGGFYIDRSELDEFARNLESVAGNIKDLTKVYRTIGRYTGRYVEAHEPLPSYDTSKNSSSHLPLGHLQSSTKGGGGKGGAWVTVKGVPYIFVQEFGGGVPWRRGKHSHIIYSKPRRRLGYFLWNVGYRLRSYIGEELTEGLSDISRRYGISMDIDDTNLNIEQKPGPG